MREQILNLINTKPKHYSLLIKNNQQLLEWVTSNSKIVSDHFPTMIYSAVYGVDPVCKNGKIKKLKRWTQGLITCGPANECLCNRENISNSVKNIKSNYSDLKKQEIEHKRTTTMLSKYGVKYNSQRQEIKTILTKSKLSVNQYSLLSDRSWVEKQYMELKRTAIDIAEELNCHDSAVRRYVALHGFNVRNYSQRSRWELKICRFLESLNINYVICDREILNGEELDIYIPNHNLAIEVNGLLYHGFNPTSFHIIRQNNVKEQRNRHLNKTLLAASKNIKLLHFTDSQIRNQWDIVSNIILSKLNKQSKIGARTCEIRMVNVKDQRIFFDRTHMHGYISNAMTYGLYYNDKLVQCISIGKNRYRKNELEILRFSSELNITIVGGLSKLIKKIISDNPNDIITTYCDRDISDASGYINSGFQIIGHTHPGYFWTDGNQVISRYKAQKRQLSKWLDNYDEKLSESQNMFNAGYLRYWNTGNIILKYNR